METYLSLELTNLPPSRKVCQSGWVHGTRAETAGRASSSGIEDARREGAKGGSILVSKSAAWNEGDELVATYCVLELAFGPSIYSTLSHIANQSPQNKE